jgi:hypothetical protein
VAATFSCFEAHIYLGPPRLPLCMSGHRSMKTAGQFGLQINNHALEQRARAGA